MHSILQKKITGFIVLVSILALFDTATAQLVALTGKYTGTGNNNTSIAGLGFKPDLLLVNSGQFHAQITTVTMPSNNTKSMNGGVTQSGLIKSLDLDGFTLGNDNNVNKAGEVYNYLALKAEAGVVEMGTYLGNNTDNRNITGISFKPEMVIILSEGNNQKPIYSSTTMGADQSTNFLNSGFQTNRIQGFNSTGFQVGKNNAVNASGVTYHFIALKSVPGSISIGAYTGDGSVNRIIPEPGLGSFVMVKRSGSNAIHRNRDMPADNSYYFKNAASVSNRIKLNTAGGFELGDNNDVNQSGKEYHYLKLIGLNTILPVNLISFDAKPSRGSVQLNWEIADGQQVTSFIIERSTDYLVFETIGKVDAQVGNNSGSYAFTDSDAEQGYSYYRLKITGPAGMVYYSELKNVFIHATSPGNQFNIYPNPVAANFIRIEQTIPVDSLQVDIFDLNGRKLDSRVLINGNSYMELKSTLPDGIYYLIGSSNKTILFKKKIVKL